MVLRIEIDTPTPPLLGGPGAIAQLLLYPVTASDARLVAMSRPLREARISSVHGWSARLPDGQPALADEGRMGELAQRLAPLYARWIKAGRSDAATDISQTIRQLFATLAPEAWCNPNGRFITPSAWISRHSSHATDADLTDRDLQAIAEDDTHLARRQGITVMGDLLAARRAERDALRTGILARHPSRTG